MVPVIGLSYDTIAFWFGGIQLLLHRSGLLMRSLHLQRNIFDIIDPCVIK